MCHHIHTSNAPVEEYPAVSESVATATHEALETAINALELARLPYPANTRFFKDMGEAIQFLIERYESIRY